MGSWTASKLSIESWFTDMELSTSDSISGSVFLFLATVDQTQVNWEMWSKFRRSCHSYLSLWFSKLCDPLCGIHKSRCFCSIPMIVTDSLHSFSDVPVLGRSFASCLAATNTHLAPVFLPGESQGWGSLVGCRLWDSTGLDMTEAT